jgi:heat shock protein HtpX
MSLSDYHASSGDWRAQLQKNERKTRWVIVTFVCIYLALGLLIDVLILQSMYPNALVSQCLQALITFQTVPIASIIMLGIAGVSVLIAYTMTDRIMLLGTDYQEITPQTARNLQEKQLFNVVEEMKVAAGLSFMPKVYLIHADYMNAFASGTREQSAMIAITRGLLEKLDRAELQAVMGHELSHIRHHDTKVLLMVAILSNLLLIVVDLLFYSMIFGRDNRREDNRLWLVIMVLRYVLPLITVALALFLSRTREFMADAGAVELLRNNEPMARALLKITDDHQQHAEQYAKAYGRTPHEDVRKASYLFDPSLFDPVKSLNSAFSTHPSVEQRLEALGYKKKRRGPEA